MTERCSCGCMERRDRFGNYDLCPLAEAWLEQQESSDYDICHIPNNLDAVWSKKVA